MKTVILAGGLGTRLSEETNLKPKPMIEIGGKPILWHIMKLYSSFGLNEFIICCGYKGYMIKEYFANYFLHMSDVTIDLSNNKMTIHQNNAETWKITLVDTGEKSNTGGRLLRIKKYVEKDANFCLTYGDGVGNINIKNLISYHAQQKKYATVTAVHPPGRFGALVINNGSVTSFQEKPPGDGGMINGGFFVLSPQVFSYLEDDQTIWERSPLKRLAQDNQLSAFEHNDFWHPMDTLRDKNKLEKLWQQGDAPWKTW